MAVDGVKNLHVLIEESRLELGGNSSTYPSVIEQLDRLAHDLDSGRLGDEVLEDTISVINDEFPVTFTVGTVGAATSKLQAAIIEIQNTRIDFARLRPK